MVNVWHDVSVGDNAPEEVNVIVEIPSGSHNKYELDKQTGLIKLDRVLHASFHYPGNYGFIPQTLCEDNDPLDVIVLTHSPLHPGVMLVVRPVGSLTMNDNGEPDDKILAVPVHDPRYKEIVSLKDVPKHFLLEIKYFFERYKDLEGKKVVIKDWNDSRVAHKLIKDSMAMYKKKFNQ